MKLLNYKKKIIYVCLFCILLFTLIFYKDASWAKIDIINQDVILDFDTTLLLTTLLMLFYMCLLFILYLVYKGLIRLFRRRLKYLIYKDINAEKYLVYYQPIINPLNKKISGFEALIRYEHPYLGILTPDKFLRRIESYGMMPDLTLWIISKVIKDYKKIYNRKIFDGDLYEKFYISINVSPRELENSHFIKHCIKLLEHSKLPKQLLCIELLESDKITDLLIIKSHIGQLKQAGFLIAIDDFGSGYATLSLLHSIDYDILKVDRSLLNDLEKSVVNQQILEFLSDWGIIHDKKIVFEGVESVFQKDFIQNLSFENHYIQGYYYSKPLKFQEVMTYRVL